jgi:Spy/CpxP family protein refolding chaperone
MHPGFFGWWKGHHGHHGHHGHGCGSGCGPQGGEECGPRWGGRHGFGGGGGFPGHHGGHAHAGPDFDAEGGGFGVRRPLRFLAWKLELEEAQIGKLAAILDELKIERAQASVDNRRSIGNFADAVAGADFDPAKAKEAGEGRVKSAEKLRDAVVTALGKIHGILDAEQREKLAYLLRTGTLVI